MIFSSFHRLRVKIVCRPSVFCIMRFWGKKKTYKKKSMTNIFHILRLYSEKKKKKKYWKLLMLWETSSNRTELCSAIRNWHCICRGGGDGGGEDPAEAVAVFAAVAGSSPCGVGAAAGAQKTQRWQSRRWGVAAGGTVVSVVVPWRLSPRAWVWAGEEVEGERAAGRGISFWKGEGEVALVAGYCHRIRPRASTTKVEETTSPSSRPRASRRIPPRSLPLPLPRHRPLRRGRAQMPSESRWPRGGRPTRRRLKRRRTSLGGYRPTPPGGSGWSTPPLPGGWGWCFFLLLQSSPRRRRRSTGASPTAGRSGDGGGDGGGGGGRVGSLCPGMEFMKQWAFAWGRKRENNKQLNHALNCFQLSKNYFIIDPWHLGVERGIGAFYVPCKCHPKSKG